MGHNTLNLSGFLIFFFKQNKFGAVIGSTLAWKSSTEEQNQNKNYIQQIKSFVCV